MGWMGMHHSMARGEWNRVRLRNTALTSQTARLSTTLEVRRFGALALSLSASWTCPQLLSFCFSAVEPWRLVISGCSDGFWCWWGWGRTETVLPCFWAEDPDANRNSRKHIVLMLRRMKCKDRKHGRMNTLAKLSRDNKKFEVWLRNEHHYTRIVCGKKYVVFNLLSVVQVLVLPVPPLEKPSIFVGDYDAIPCKNQNQHQIRLEETKQWKVNEVR